MFRPGLPTRLAGQLRDAKQAREGELVGGSEGMGAGPPPCSQATGDTTKVQGHPCSLDLPSQHRKGLVAWGNDPGYGDNGQDSDYLQPSPRALGPSLAGGGVQCMGAVHRLNGSGWGLAAGQQPILLETESGCMEGA